MGTDMRRFRFIGTVAISLTCMLAAQRAARANLEPDQAVAALASVVETRAKVVAAQTIEDELSDSLCSKSVAVEPNSNGLKHLCFGGDLKNCGKPAHDADDVFVESCHLIKDVSLDLVDPHLLNAISRDAVGLMLR